MIQRRFHVYGEAAAELRRSIEIDPANAEAHFELGLTEAARRKKPAAIAAYDEVIRLAPADARPWYEKSKLLTSSGERGERISVLRGAIERNPSHIEARHDLSQVHLEAEEYDLAAAQYEEILKLDPDRVDTRVAYADYWVKKRQLRNAEDLLVTYLKRHPRDARVRSELGGLYRLAKETEKARIELEEALRENPALPKAQGTLGMILLERGDLDAAEARFSQVVSLDSGSAEGPHGLGCVAARRGDLDRAIELQKKAVALNPKSYEAYRELGQLYARKGMERLSSEAFAKAVQLEPMAELSGATDVTRALGSFEPEDEGDDEVAQLEARVQSEPANVMNRVSLGGALYRKGRVEEAVDVLRKALEGDPRTGPAHYYLGLCYVEKNEAQKALASFEEYLRLDPKAPNRDEVSEEITKLKRKK
jgi:tetratricopeptide (TPR) repeat protein